MSTFIFSFHIPPSFSGLFMKELSRPVPRVPASPCSSVWAKTRTEWSWRWMLPNGRHWWLSALFYLVLNWILQAKCNRSFKTLHLHHTDAVIKDCRTTPDTLTMRELCLQGPSKTAGTYWSHISCFVAAFKAHRAAVFQHVGDNWLKGKEMFMF